MEVALDADDDENEDEDEDEDDGALSDHKSYFHIMYNYYYDNTKVSFCVFTFFASIFSTSYLATNSAI